MTLGNVKGGTCSDKAREFSVHSPQLPSAVWNYLVSLVPANCFGCMSFI